MSFFSGYIADFSSGVLITLELTVLGWAGALLLGTVLTAMRVSPIRTLNAAATAYVTVFRNIPLPVQMVLFVFGLPLLGIQYPLFASAAIVLVIYTAPFVSETLRSGLNTVSTGELEALRALGFGPRPAMQHIILPQAFGTVIQPLGNVLITMIKNTSVAALVGVADLTFTTNKAAVDQAQPFLIFSGAAISYLLIGLIVGRLVGILDRKAAFSR
ncbi:amino acid ABC transporter permease [Pseudarthrobacter phenanthrenivorans]|uniref:amino acid ABC transporter permease n=1 Tax=Pseudarthrobacter phenanthrenivorans TaxID=361575 RepID=UPI002F34F915